MGDDNVNPIRQGISQGISQGARVEVVERPDIPPARRKQIPRRAYLGQRGEVELAWPRIRLAAIALDGDKSGFTHVVPYAELRVLSEEEVKAEAEAKAEEDKAC